MIENIEEKITYQLNILAVREMKNPTIVMNPIDFEDYRNYVESKVKNLKIVHDPHFNGVPIKVKSFIEQGTVIIYDDITPVKSSYVSTCPDGKQGKIKAL